MKDQRKEIDERNTKVSTKWSDLNSAWWEEKEAHAKAHLEAIGLSFKHKWGYEPNLISTLKKWIS